LGLEYTRDVCAAVGEDVGLEVEEAHDCLEADAERDFELEVTGTFEVLIAVDTGGVDAGNTTGVSKVPSETKFAWRAMLLSVSAVPRVFLVKCN
jgi:hypothetical protein